jgi:hypothetical protein
MIYTVWFMLGSIEMELITNGESSKVNLGRGDATKKYTQLSHLKVTMKLRLSLTIMVGRLREVSCRWGYI